MARHYSIKSFFRDIPPGLLARYFERQGVLHSVDFSAMKGADRGELFNAWLDLPQEKRRYMEGDFYTIFEMSRDAAMPPIIEEAAWQMRGEPAVHAAFVEMFSALPNNHERAMVAFLDYNKCWKGARLLYYADTLPHWRKRKGFPHRPAAVDPSSIEALSGLIRDFFHRKEGRGDSCHIDCLRRGDLDYFFAYPADYSRQANEYVDGVFAPRPHTPAFEILYIYSEKDGSLDLNFRGDHSRAEKVQTMFAKAILNLPGLPPVRKNLEVYDFSQFRRESPVFLFEPDSGIERVVVKLLRLSSKVVPGDRITVEANAEENETAVYALLAKIGRSVNLDLYNITRVELTASVVLKAGSKANLIPICITYPNSCSLKYDELGLKLRGMLAASGIEPIGPPAGTGS